MEARKLEPVDDHDYRYYETEAEPCEYDQPFGWRQLAGLVHPYVWTWIAALWFSLACLILFEAG